MGSRRAVAATLVSVIVFTSLVFANAALYAAGNTYLSSSVLSTAQQREYDYASFLIGLSSYSSLAATQNFLQAHPLDCSGPVSSYLDSLTGGTDTSGTSGGIDYSVGSSWSYAATTASHGIDDVLSKSLATIQPFGGYSDGGLNVVVATSVNETELGGLPAYHAEAVETVHLPVSIDAAVSLCRSALSAMDRAISSLSACDASSVDDAISLVRSENPAFGSIQLGASGQGRELPGVAGTCSVQYWVTMTEVVQGVSGAFDWTVNGSGSLST